MTSQLQALKDFIIEQKLTDDESIADGIVDDIQLACAMESPLQSVFYEFERRGIVFENEQQARQFMPLIIEVYNHTRLWSNRGHTPEGIRVLTGESTPSRYENVIQFPKKSEKIGRNEPCPCGSGKKYKRCCGQ